MAESLVPNFEVLSIDSEDEVSINYADNEKAFIKRCPIDAEMALSKDIVIFGEGNFTFSVALAALTSELPNSIITTRYEDITSNEDIKSNDSEVKLKKIDRIMTGPGSDIVKLEQINRVLQDQQILNPKPVPLLSDVKLLNIEYIMCNAAPVLDRERITRVLKVQQGDWRFGIDATSIPDDLDVRGKTVWFQCPWSRSSTPADLVKQFIVHMASKQACGDHLLIGIANLFPYVKSYRLQDILDIETYQGKDSESEADFRRIINTHYTFTGCNDTLIRDILHYGYKHEGCCEIHDIIRKHQLTLIFVRIPN